MLKENLLHNFILNKRYQQQTVYAATLLIKINIFSSRPSLTVILLLKRKEQVQAKSPSQTSHPVQRCKRRYCEA